MATLFPMFEITDEEIGHMIAEDNLNVTVEQLRIHIDELNDLEQSSPASAGAKAPDFKAEMLSAEGERTGEIFQLSALKGKVVGLMFGSYTCPIFSGKTKRHQEIYDTLKDRVEFNCVYTYEAHPSDGPWPLESYDEPGMELANHRNMDDRAVAAKACKLGLGLTVPMVLDSMGDEIVRLYNGSPERLYVINREGIITFRSSVGPFDMEDVENWYQALLKETDTKL